MNDLRYALRALRHSPGFTAMAVLTLALGIGANTAVFSVVEGVLLRSLPFPGADRLVDIKSISERYRRPGSGGGTSPFAAYQTWRTASGVFEELAAAMGSDPVLLGHGDAERLKNAWHVTANFLPLLGAQPFLGRAFLAEEDRPESVPAAVLSYPFWQSHFGGDPHVLGRSLMLDTTSYTIIGVMPREFRYPVNTDVWLSLGPLFAGPSGDAWRHRWGFWVIGRLVPGITVAGAQAALDVVTPREWESEPRTRGWVPAVTPLHDFLVGGVRTPLLLMLGAVSLVLIVACANVASLLTSRGAAREHEVALRAALGAGNARLLREVLTEAIVLALGGGAVAVLLALWSVPILVRLAGADLPHLSDITVDAPVLAAAFGMSLFAGVAAGLIPAIRASRQAPAEVLKATSPATAGRRWRHRSDDVLLVAQLALTVVLLSAAGLLTRSFMRLVVLDPGFEPEHVVVAELRLPSKPYETPHLRAVFAREALARARALPGVVTAAVSEGMPLDGYAFGTVDIPGQPEDPGRPLAHIWAVTSDYFRTLGIPLRHGHMFVDGSSELSGVIIDEAAARAYFPGQDPLAQHITFGVTRTVMGVVGDTRQERLDAPPPPHIYQLLVITPGDYLKILVRTTGDPVAAISGLRRAIQTIDANVPIDRVAPLGAWMGDAIASHRLYTSLLAIFALLTLAVAATGVYGLAAYATTRRTQEIGIRLSLGADREAVVQLIVGHGLALALTGIALGVVGALATMRVLRAYLFEVGPRDPAVLISVALLIVASALVASYLPAHSAARVNPMVALRSE